MLELARLVFAVVRVVLVRQLLGVEQRLLGAEVVLHIATAVEVDRVQSAHCLDILECRHGGIVG